MTSSSHRFLLYVASLFAFLVAVELLLFAVPNEYSYKRDYVEQQGDKIKVLILGHSLTANGIDPELLGDSVFNMAISARRHHYDAVLAERYIPKLSNLQCVIWPLGYNQQYISYIYPCVPSQRTKGGRELQSSLQCSNEKYFGISYERCVPYLHWSELVNNTGAMSIGRIKNAICGNNTYTPMGYGRLTLRNREDNWRETQLPFHPEYDNPNAPLAKQEGMNSMKRIAEVCREAGVRLIVVTTPCHKSFRDLTTERGMAEMQECVDTMRRAYPQMEYYNFMADPRFVDDDFFNSSHICDPGVKKFCKILKEILTQPQ